GIILTRLTPTSMLVAAGLVWIVWRETKWPKVLCVAGGGPVVLWATYAAFAFGTIFPVSGRVKLEGSIVTLDTRFWPGLPLMAKTTLTYLWQVLKFTMGFDSTFWGVQGPSAGRLVPGLTLLLLVSALAMVWRRGCPRGHLVLLTLIGLSVSGMALVPILLHR